MRIHVDKLASVTRNLRLGRTLTLSSELLLEEGSVIACKIRGEKTTYNQLEEPHGRMSTLHDGDILVGALGHRNALQGYEGVMPTALKTGDTVNLLNMGGVIGLCRSHNPDVGKPFEMEVLGQVQVFPEFQSRAARAHPHGSPQGHGPDAPLPGGVRGRHLHERRQDRRRLRHHPAAQPGRLQGWSLQAHGCLPHAGRPRHA